MATTNLHPRSLCWTWCLSWAILRALAVVLFFAWSLVAIYWPREAGPATVQQQGGKDLQAYRRIVERVHHGEGYYPAAAEELRMGGYASSSVLNWRLPTYAWLLAAFPTPAWGQVLLALLALSALALAFAAERRAGGGWRCIVLVLAMAGAFLWCIDGDAFFSQELWAGVLIALSVSAAGKKALTPISVAAGLAALWLRELALPYVLVALVLASCQKRWTECVAWCGGLAVIAGFFAWHAWQVHQQLTGLEFVEREGWVQFGGPAFVVATCHMNEWLFKLPDWVVLLYLSASLWGLATCRGPGAVRVGVTVGAYLIAFLVVGKPFNNYWGLLYAALLPFGLVRVPDAFNSLLAELRGCLPWPNAVLRTAVKH